MHRVPVHPAGQLESSFKVPLRMAIESCDPRRGGLISGSLSPDSSPNLGRCVRRRHLDIRQRGASKCSTEDTCLKNAIEGEGDAVHSSPEMTSKLCQRAVTTVDRTTVLSTVLYLLLAGCILLFRFISPKISRHYPSSTVQYESVLYDVSLDDSVKTASLDYS